MALRNATFFLFVLSLLLATGNGSRPRTVDDRRAARNPAGGQDRPFRSVEAIPCNTCGGGCCSIPQPSTAAETSEQLMRATDPFKHGDSGRVLDGWVATQGHTSRGLQQFVVVKASPSPKPATVVVKKVSPSPKPATVVVKKVSPSLSPAVVVKQVVVASPKSPPPPAQVVVVKKGD